MQQLEFFDIPSPCIGVCQAGERGYCKGCFRSRDERLHWHKLSDDVKHTIIRACTRRKAAASRRQRQQQLGNEQQQTELFPQQDPLGSKSSDSEGL